ncbi:acyltransferase [Sphingobium sp.]|uniref:acyltransferase family protein n=1 Tax=Sphingobium sp. TaxID=1912891 RepID=UPI002C28414C|nr:acyltransferase [Sphingobium sp.]HUD90559.1 acyltransferase [Sphingobium sp.]
MDVSRVSTRFSVNIVEQSTQQRQLWMDLLRGMAILMVISFHSATILERHDYAIPPLLANFNQLFVLYRMPTLVFLSGSLLAASFKKGITLYLLGKVRRIFWPLLIWSLIYSYVIGPPVLDAEQLRKYLTGQSYLWFLTFILVYYLAAIPLRRVPPLLVVAVAFVIAILAPDGTKNGERLFYLMAFFFLGAWAGSHWQSWIRILQARASLLAWCAVILGAIASVVYHLSYGPLYALPALCFILAVSATAYRAQAGRWSAPLIFIGQNSLIFYVSHFTIIYLVIGLCSRLGVAAEVATIASFPVALIVGMVLAVVARRNGIVNLLFVAPPPPHRVVGALQAVERRFVPA